MTDFEQAMEAIRKNNFDRVDNIIVRSSNTFALILLKSVNGDRIFVTDKINAIEFTIESAYYNLTFTINYNGNLERFIEHVQFNLGNYLGEGDLLRRLHNVAKTLKDKVKGIGDEMVDDTVVLPPLKVVIDDCTDNLNEFKAIVGTNMITLNKHLGEPYLEKFNDLRQRIKYGVDGGTLIRFVTQLRLLISQRVEDMHTHDFHVNINTYLVSNRLEIIQNNKVVKKYYYDFDLLDIESYRTLF